MIPSGNALETYSPELHCNGLFEGSLEPSKISEKSNSNLIFQKL